MKRMIMSIILGLFLLVNLTGCEAFVRKFTRKPKGDDKQQVEMVLAPQEYKSTLTKDEQYRQYLLFWKSWQDELIAALAKGNSTIGPNTKKQMECLDQGIKNLMGMRSLLNEQGKEKLDVYIGKMSDLRSSIKQDPYMFGMERYSHSAQRLRMDILGDFSYKEIKQSLI